MFARHGDYWGGVPDIEFLHLKYYETTDDVEAALLSGDLDMALGIGPLTPKQVQDLKFSCCWIKAFIEHATLYKRRVGSSIKVLPPPSEVQATMAKGACVVGEYPY